MALRDFFSLHREELLQACETELSGETSMEQLARELRELLEHPPSAHKQELPMGEVALLGDDPAIRRVRASIEQMARCSRIPVLFLGEMGTGKQHSARLLHASTYPEGEFFELENDEQLPLLGRRLAALRVPSTRQAMGGLSVYVNELSEASKPVQAALARLLSEHGLRFRLLASSRLPLAHACREGHLRSDLVFGFSTVIELPNLRDRLTDLKVLLAHFMAQSRFGSRAPLSFSDSALQTLASYAWPGNLIELSRLIERLQGLDDPGTIDAHHLQALGHGHSGMVVNLPPSGIDLAKLERELLLQALALADNNRTRAARLLGLTRDQIRYRMGKLDMDCAADAE